MKNLFLIGVLLFVLQSGAQNFLGGFFAGPVASQVYGDNISGYDKSGFHFGAFTKRMFNDNMGFQLEMKYINKGSRKHIKVDNPTFYLLKLQYVEIPFMFMLRYNDRFTFSAGASYGVLIKAQEDFDGYGFTEPDNPPYKGYEIAGQASFYYTINEILALEFRASYSLTPIRPYPGNQQYFLDAGQRNNLLSFALYYTFSNE